MRENLADGLYRISGVPEAAFTALQTRYVGSQLETLVDWRTSPHMTLSGDYAHFFRGPLRRDNNAKPVGDVHGMGLFWGVELVKNRITKEPFNTMRDKVEGKLTVVDQVAAKMLTRGVVQQAWVSHFVIAPPLIVTEAELDEGIDAMDEALTIADALVE